MVRWLFDLDDLRGWAQHEDEDVRRWAVSHWLLHHPDQHLEELALRLNDPDEELQRDVALHLAETGQDRWAIVMIKGMELMQGRQRVSMIEALGQLRHPMAVPVLASALRGASGGLELVALMHALGRFRVEGAWSALMPLFDLLREENSFSAALARIILGMSRRSDVGPMVKRWRHWDGKAGVVGSAFYDWLAVHDRIAAYSERVLDAGPKAVIEAAETIVGEQPELRAAIPTLEAAAQQGNVALLNGIYSELVRILQGRGENFVQWFSEHLGLPMHDYRALVVGAEALVDELRREEPAAGREAVEVGLAMAALITVAARQHEEKLLSEAEDPGPLALSFVLDSRRGMCKQTKEAVVLLGEEALPVLQQALESPYAHVLFRATSLLEDIGLENPQLASRCAWLIAEALSATQDANVHERMGSALIRLGPDCLPAVISQLQAEQPHSEIYRVLGSFPTEEVWEALEQRLDLTPTSLDIELAQAMVNLGDARAMTRLQPFWQPGEVELAAMLRGLALVNDIYPKDFELWIKDLDQELGREAMMYHAMQGEPAES